VFTSIDVDDELFKKAYGISPERTKKGFFEELMRMYLRLHEQAGVRSLRGKLVWAEDLEAIRGERLADPR
jgi:Arc/MetJ family transcription regulator